MHIRGAFVLAAALLLMSCGDATDGGTGPAGTTQDDAEAATSHTAGGGPWLAAELVSDHLKAATFAPMPYESVSELMPTTVFVMDGQEQRMSEVFVVGKVSTVEAGRSFRWNVTGPEKRFELPFNDPDAEVSTVHLAIEVSNSVTAPGVDDVGAAVTVGLALPAPVDVDALSRDFADRGSIVVYLEKSPVIDYDPAVWSVVGSGMFIGEVGADQSITFPVVENEGILSREKVTVDQLVQQPPARIVVSWDNNGWNRETSG